MSKMTKVVFENEFAHLAADKKPTDFSTAITTALYSRVRDAIDIRRDAVSADLFSEKSVFGESFDVEEVALMEAKTAKEIGTHLISKFGNDPLYSDVITAILAKDKAGAQKAMKTLGSIRGPQAVKNLQSAYKSFVSENVDMLDERRRVINAGHGAEDITT